MLRKVVKSYSFCSSALLSEQNLNSCEVQAIFSGLALTYEYIRQHMLPYRALTAEAALFECA